jgi:hypothetical protein
MENPNFFSSSNIKWLWFNIHPGINPEQY